MKVLGTIFGSLLALSCAATAVAGVSAQDTTLPALVGISPDRLARLDQLMQKQIDENVLAGSVTLVSRHGKVINFSALGMQDIEQGKAMSKDSIFRIYSMTKPITTVAMMLLYEEGKWQPSDPISKFIPAFENSMVYQGRDLIGRPMLVKPEHAPTLGELLTHTAGIGLGFFDTPVDKMYANANLWGSASLEELVNKIAQLPLKYQPGESWDYSFSADVVGYIVERLSGQTLADFYQERIFKPLNMNDTAFYVPQEKLARVAKIYQPEKGKLSALPLDPNITKLPALLSGGGGLYSTAEDFYHFAQMLADNGQYNGKAFLSPSSIKLMRSNHLPAKLQNGTHGIGFYKMQPGFGFGYNVGVFEDPIKVGSTTGAGTFLWDGLAGTWFWIDPTSDIVFIGLIQRWGFAPGMPNLEDLSRTLVHQALVAPEK